MAEPVYARDISGQCVCYLDVAANQEYEQQSILPDEQALDAFLTNPPPIPDATCEPSANGYYNGMQKLTPSPEPATEATDLTVDVKDMGASDLQETSAAYYGWILQVKREAEEAVDALFAQEIKRFTELTTAGVEYDLQKEGRLLPKTVKDEIRGTLKNNPSLDLAGMKFAWAWGDDGRPNIFFYRKDPCDPNQRLNVDIETGEVSFQGLDTQQSIPVEARKSLDAKDYTTIAIGSLTLNGVKNFLPAVNKYALPVAKGVGRLGLQGALGAGLLVGIHYSVLALNVPEEYSSLVEMPVALGFAKGLGAPLGRVVGDIPLMVPVGLGFSLALDALGCEMDRDRNKDDRYEGLCNDIGTTFATVTTYIGVEKLITTPAALEGTGFLNTLKIAMNSTRGVGLFETAVAGGISGFTPRNFLMSPAGGAGWLGGTLQVLNAAGAVTLGNYFGGVGVKMWEDISDIRIDFPIYDMVDGTWEKINNEVLGSVGNALVGNLAKAIESAFMSDELLETMEMLWYQQSMECDMFVMAVDDFLLKNMEKSFSISDVEVRNDKIHLIHSADSIEDILMNEFKNMSDGTRDLYFGKELDRPIGKRKFGPGLIELLVKTPATRDLVSDDTWEFFRVVGRNGNIRNAEQFRARLKAKLLDYSLTPRGERSVGREFIKQRLAMAEKRLKDRQDRLGIGAKLDLAKITPEQSEFMFGGPDVIQKLEAGNIKESEIMSEAIVLELVISFWKDMQKHPEKLIDIIVTTVTSNDGKEVTFEFEE